MDIQNVLKELDCLVKEQRTEEIPSFFDEKCLEAEGAEQFDALLILYNEEMGFYRETGNYKKSIEASEKAMVLAEQMGITGSVPYATTLLNAANAHRAAGLPDKSLELYARVFEIYEKELPKQDMYFANLYNNISLVYQEIQEYAKAKDALLKALGICLENVSTDFEIAVTHANLANTCIQLNQLEEAGQHGAEAVRMFEEQGIDDAHYSAALSALGSIYYKQGLYEQAADTIEKARECVARYFGRNNIQYERLTENLELIRKTYRGEQGENEMRGLELCRRYYEEFGRSMIADKFAEYESRIAVGLVGQGSDCFGYDDEISKDHDYGPRFMMWLTKETYAEIGEALQKAYDELPKAFMGVEIKESVQSGKRSGVFVIEDFYKQLMGMEYDVLGAENWLAAPEYGLAAAVNGEVFRDDEGHFTTIREKLLSYYPKAVWYRKIAQECALFSQNGQYNLLRMQKRGQLVAAELAKAECVKHAMKLCYLLERTYAPHDKWLFKGLQEIEAAKGLLSSACEQVGLTDTSVTKLIEKLCMLQVGGDVGRETEVLLLIERLATIFACCLEQLGIVGYAEPYLDADIPEIVIKSDALLSAGENVTEGLALLIAKTEFEAFDKVQNEGGRASCQNNWTTFKIMRMSQYLTWDEEMLLQYIADFTLNFRKGRNMIEEKYARMMESTAPQEYAKFAQSLPHIPEEKRAIMEEIIRMQVQWMEAFAKEYPNLAENARSIHTSEDNLYNTSYETYLRGELGTYSDKMLEMYGRYIVRHLQNGQNVAREIMWNTIQFYGYSSFEDAM